MQAVMEKPKTINELVEDLLLVKAQAAPLEERRKQIVAQIAAEFADPAKPEGAITKLIDGFKVTVEFKTNRKVDSVVLQAAWPKMSPAAQSGFKWKPEVTADYKKLAGAALLEASKFVTSTPGTPAVEVKI